MMTNDEGEFWVIDRIQKIRQIIGQYGEERFFLSFSGGKDSTALSALLDEAITNNSIPRVFVNTGIEYQLIVKFVREMAKKDSRVVIINSGINIQKMLKEYGYPFKSKNHSTKLDLFQRYGMTPYVARYLNKEQERRWGCPKILEYQFDGWNGFRVSPKCCDKLKKEPLNNYMCATGKKCQLVGLVKEEKGQRAAGGKCVSVKGTAVKFSPLFPVQLEWIDWYVRNRNIQLCELYYPPYHMNRTGCTGCPFGTNLQSELDMMGEYLPNERKKAERIWQPVYDEYRRLGYRLRQQMTTDDLQFLQKEGRKNEQTVQ